MIFFKGLKSEFKIAVVNEPSVFEPLKFYCIMVFFQIDMSCLNALPPSLQREIKEAYARQDSKKLGAVRKDNVLKLQQAKSPGKSPNKRYSPSACNYLCCNISIFM